MHTERWDIGTAVTSGWELFKENAGILLGATLLMGFVQGVFSGVMQGIQTVAMQLDSEVGAVIAIGAVLVINIVSWLVNIYLTMGYLRMTLAVVRGEPADFMMLFSGTPYLVAGVVASILISLGTTFGFLLLIVPGVIVALGWSFTLFLVVDRDLGPIEALSMSWQITNGEKAMLFGWFFVAGCIIMAGVAACCVGVLIAGPVVAVGTAYVYDNCVQRNADAYA